MNLLACLDALARSNANATSAKAATASENGCECSQVSQLSHSQTTSSSLSRDSDFRAFRSFRVQDGETAASALERLAILRCIDWGAAHSEMESGDLDRGCEQLLADEGDGFEVAGVDSWLRLLEQRAFQFGWASRSSAIRHALDVREGESGTVAKQAR